MSGTAVLLGDLERAETWVGVRGGVENGERVPDMEENRGGELLLEPARRGGEGKEKQEDVE